MFNIKVDYLSFNLNEVFTPEHLIKYANQKTIDKETGLVTGVRVEPSQFNLYYAGANTVTASFWKGGEQVAMQLAHRKGLRVTRLDLTLDLDPSITDFEGIVAKLDAMLAKKYYSMPTRMRFDGTYSPTKGVGASVSYWTRGGDKQLRIYQKKLDGVEFIRVEFQLRGDIAREAFLQIRDSYPRNTQIQLETFKGLCDLYLGEEDVFNLAAVTAKQLTRPSKVNPNEHATRSWILNVVAPALARYYNTTGYELHTELLKEVERLVISKAGDNEKITLDYNEKKLKSLQYQTEKKGDRFKKPDFEGTSAILDFIKDIAKSEDDDYEP